MALISRVSQPVAPAPSAAPTAGRAIAVGRAAASDRGAVEEVNTSGSISFDNTALIFQEQTQAQKRGEGGQNKERRYIRPPAENPTGFNAPTDLFASLLEINERGEKADSSGEKKFSGGPGDVKRAIGIYESTVSAISASVQRLGSSLSLTL
jgi:hypothetical protein